MTTCCAALLECQQLLSTECLVVDLGCGFDHVLKMSSCEEVSEINEFTVVLILDVDDTPSVLATADLLSANDN